MTAKKNATTTKTTVKSAELPCGKKVSTGQLRRILARNLSASDCDVTGFITCLKDGTDWYGRPRGIVIVMMALDGTTHSIPATSVTDVKTVRGFDRDAVADIVKQAIAVEQAKADAEEQKRAAERALQDAKDETFELSRKMEAASGYLSDNMLAQIATRELKKTNAYVEFNGYDGYNVSNIRWHKDGTQIGVRNNELTVSIEVSSDKYEDRRATFCSEEYDGTTYIADGKAAESVAKKVYQAVFRNQISDLWRNGIPYSRVKPSMYISDKGIIVCCYELAAPIKDRSEDGIAKLARDLVDGKVRNILNKK